jgi:mono/diheme cytochrome c family protein
MSGARVTAIVALLAVSAASHAADYVQMSGQELYMRFCASCHGEHGRGDGPVSSSLKVEMPDLATIARRSHGDVRERIARVIDGRYIIGAHGTRTMPVWGEDFNMLEVGNPDAERATRAMIERIADYVLSLQVSTGARE